MGSATCPKVTFGQLFQLFQTPTRKEPAVCLDDRVLHLCSLIDLLKVLILYIFYFYFQFWFILQFISTTFFQKKSLCKYFNPLLYYPSEIHKIYSAHVHNVWVSDNSGSLYKLVPAACFCASPTPHVSHNTVKKWLIYISKYENQYLLILHSTKVFTMI